MEYYIVVDTYNQWVVTQVARGGSRAGCINEYGRVDHENVKPYIFTNEEDAKMAVAKADYYKWDDPAWTVKKININL